MSDSLFLSLRDGVRLTPRGGAHWTIQYGSWTHTFEHLEGGTATALRQLGNGGAFEGPLTDEILRTDGGQALARFYLLLRRLSQWGLLHRSMCLNGERLATLVPTSAHFHYPWRAVTLDGQYLLSRFAYTRAEGRQMWLESPAAHCRIVVHDWRVWAVVHALAQPRTARALADNKVVDLPPAAAPLLLTLLLNAAMLTELTETGKPLEDEDPSLRSWEFHDLLFHSRSRDGRHDYPVGGTFRFLHEIEPPAALKAKGSGDAIDLERPDLDRSEREDPPFARVHERRRSIREYGARPITVQQLGEFLYRVARVTQSNEFELQTDRGPIRMEFAHRPYPSAGALYELELYLAVRACDGIPAGFYHYDARDHRLERISDLEPDADGLLSGASNASGIPVEELQVLVTVSARFQRVAWKYSSMAYAAILKDVGVLYQTMYLAATAMELAPCGLGAGDSDLFARAAGTNYYDETSVGEFLLGSKRVNG